MIERDAVLQAFRGEADVLGELLGRLEPEDWDRPTPAQGWSVRDQVAHLAFVFDLAATAATDAVAFARKTELAAEIGFDNAVNAALAAYNHGRPEDVAGRWAQHLRRSLDALGTSDPESTVPWLVRPLPPAVLLMAGMTEVFAHGQDIADAVGATLPRTDRVAFLVPFIHHTRDFGYEARGLQAPTEPLRFEVSLPSGALAEAGPAAAADVVRGDAVDLCLLATRRRHRDDLRLEASGPVAQAWLEVAQAYRGPAGPGRSPLGSDARAVA